MRRRGGLGREFGNERHRLRVLLHAGHRRHGRGGALLRRHRRVPPAAVHDELHQSRRGAAALVRPRPRGWSSSPPPFPPGATASGSSRTSPASAPRTGPTPPAPSWVFGRGARCKIRAWRTEPRWRRDVLVALPAQNECPSSGCRRRERSRRWAGAASRRCGGRSSPTRSTCRFGG